MNVAIPTPVLVEPTVSLAAVARCRQDLLEPIQAVVTLSGRLHQLAVKKDAPANLVADFKRLQEAANNLCLFVSDAVKVLATESSGFSFDANLRQQRHKLGNLLNHVSMSCQLLMFREKKEFFEAHLADLEKIYGFYLDCEQKLSAYLRPSQTTFTRPKPCDGHEQLLVEPWKLLIVDDSAIGRQTLRELLTFQGYQISEARNGTEALRMMKRRAFDLVLLDILMPGVDGFQVLQHLKDQPEMPQSSILVISGMEDTQSAIRCIELGAEDYLTKPINHLLLHARVKSCLQKRELELRKLEQFFPAEVARQLLYKPELFREGRKADVTVLFCDIRGFSQISENLGSKKTIKWLSAVMEELSGCVHRNRGVLVDYQGDQVLAMWGAPEPQAEHAHLACKAALEMLAKVQELDTIWRPFTGAETDVSIGVNSGPAHVGNIGSKRKFKYGPLGNTVNLASRVQGATKYLKTRLLITEATRQFLGERFSVRRVSSIKAVNIKKPTHLYEVVPDGCPGWPGTKLRYEQALELFESRKLKQAAEILGNLITQHGAQGPELSLLSRTVEALVEPNKWKKVWDLPGK